MILEAEVFVSGLVSTGYLLPTVKTIELIVGVLFLFGQFIPLTLVISAPIILNIGLYHLFLDWSGLPIALLMGTTLLYLTHRYRTYFRLFFDRNTEISSFSMTKQEAEEMHEIFDGEDVSKSQNLLQVDADKMARKAFFLVAALASFFMGAGVMILSTSPDKPGTKPRTFIDSDGRYSE